MTYTKKWDWPTLIVVVLLNLSVLVAVYYGYTHYGNEGTFLGFKWVSWAIFFTLYLISGLGVTLSYHRYFTHKAFKCPVWFQWVLLAMGSLALEGEIEEWSYNHRKHHKLSDKEGDPHSPVGNFMHGHMVWFLHKFYWDGENDLSADIKNHPIASKQKRIYTPVVLAGFIVPYLIAGFEGFLLAGAVRTCWVQHVTWSVNSWCHTWGRRPYDAGDYSTNSHLIGLLALGEGYHNNHHYDPPAVFHGWERYNLDATKWVILILQKLGIVWDLHYPKVWRQAARG